jgi:hypothetical protein
MQPSAALEDRWRHRGAHWVRVDRRIFEGLKLFSVFVSRKAKIFKRQF